MGEKNGGAGRQQTWAILLAFAAIYLIWGTTYLAVRIAVQTIPPFFMAGMRFLIAGGLLFFVLRLRGEPWPLRAQWRAAAVLGAMLMAGGTGLVTWSVQQVPSGMAALIVATVPLWIALLDWLLFHGPRPGRRVTLGLLLGLLGIILLIGPGQLQGTAGFSFVALLALLFSPFFWSVGSLYSRDAELPPNAFMATAMEMLTGGALLMLLGLLTGETSRVNAASFSPISLASMLYLIIAGSIVAFSAYIWLLKVVQPTKVATYSYVNPVIAVFLGWLVLDEVVGGLTIAAVVIIILAVALITAGTPDSKPAAETVSLVEASAAPEQAREPI